MSLRSLHLDAGRTWRGGQRQVLLLADELRARGHEPLVLGAPHAPLVERAHAAGLATAAIPMRGDWDLRAARKVRTLLRTWEPDIVHAHDARAHAIALLALAGTSRTRRVRPPLIVTRRVAFVPKSVRFKYGDRVAHFVAISQAVKAAMIAGGIPAGRIEVVYSGVPAPTVTAARDWRAERGWDAGTVVVGVVGAMTSEKGIDAVARIAAALSKQDASKTKIVLLGGTNVGSIAFDGVEAYGAGFVTDIYNAMAGLDLLWHPATSEGLGTAVIDALALGIPPIAFAVGGIPEIIRDSQEGRLVPAGDVQAFASAHRTLLDPAYRDQLAQAGPARAAYFSVGRMTEKIEQVYHEVLADGVGAHRREV